MLRGIKRQYLGLALALLAYWPATSTPQVAYSSAQQLFKQRQMKQCLQEVRAGLRRVSRNRQPELYFRFRLLEAASLIGLKDPKSALVILSEPVPREAAGSPEAVLWRMNKGMAHLYNGDFDQADRDLRGAMSAAKQTGSRALVAEVEARQGAMAVRRHDNAAAETLLRSALDQATKEGNTSLRTIALGNLGLLLTQTFRLEEAVYWQEQAAAEFRKTGDLDSVARVTGNLGWSLLMLGDLNAAIARFREAEADFEATGNRVEQLTWLGNIGNVQFEQGDYAAAESSYRRAADLARQADSKLELTWWLDKMTAVAIIRKDWARAEALHSESTNLAAGMMQATPDLTAMNNAAGIAAGRGRRQEAESIYRKVSAAASDDPGPALNAHSELAAMAAEVGLKSQGRAEYQMTISLIEQQRDKPLDDRFKLTYVSTLTRFYQKYVEFLISEGDIAGALRVADSSHARMLRSLGHQFSAAATDYRRIALQTNSVLLAYWLAPERSLLWEVTRDGIHLHVLPGAARIRSLVARHNGAIANLRNPLSMGISAGDELWDILISPVTQAIASSRRVIVVPDDALYSLNLETLPVRKPLNHYWVEDATVSVVSALWLLRPHPAVPVRKASLLLIGDPVPLGPEFPRLAYASQELAEIEKHFPESNRVVLQAAAASPDAYARAVPANFSIIHFTAHAASNAENPLQSAIVLSSDKQRYLLPASDVMRIPLRATLVTVSSCSSAGSRIYSGEGLVGLTWAFLRAGANGVVAGLWDVPDRTTSKLMGELYSRLAAGAPPDLALRSAKIAILSGGHSQGLPYNWAAFQYYMGSY
jgi:CHAT domain-containing protein/Tfp pilus assembly protein PilF